MCRLSPTLPAVALSALLGLSGLVPEPAAAQVGMRIEEVADGAVRVDGSLGDWRRVRFVDVGSGDDHSMRYALRHDDDGLYVAAVVRDDRMVRTARPGPNEDAVILTLAMPIGGDRYRGVDVWLWAGVPGRQAGSAGIGPTGGRPRPLSAAQVVEGPRRRGGNGYVVEAYVPFRSIPGSARWQQGRGAIRLRDVDREARPEVEAEIGNVSVDPRSLDRLLRLMPTGGERGMLQRFLRSRGLRGTRPRHDMRGDTSGDRRPERVMIVEHYALVMGPGYREGAAFDFVELPVTSAAGVRDADLMDLTGDGKRELVVRLRQSNPRGSRDLWSVYSITEEGIAPIFGVELRKQTDDGSVEANLRVRRARRGAALITVAAGESRGLDANNLRESPPADVQPIVLPWGDIIARTWQWTGQGFEVVRERENPSPQRPEPRRARASRTDRRAAEPQPTLPGVDDLVNAFKERAGIGPRVQPRFQRTANVAEGAERERVVVFGTHLLVVGPAFRGGSGWFHFGIPVESAEDVVHVGTADFTGDGREEVVMCVRRTVDDVRRTLLLVHQFRQDGFPRLLATEVYRRQGDSFVENAPRIFRTPRGAVLKIFPGDARGWGQGSYPFTDDAGDGVDPLLLPWRDSPVIYRLQGDRLVRRP